ncbi:phosphonopyruvate decarboxylase [Polynucleobacter sp. es-GGE-1]|uniref:phosphonopyruvate decarboxylase n=1 Tax=Polynucleobacter sp. es-GGE-1 TaxID=1819724 RepID=UPI001C0AA672|nr:phosphonopyruvate decarboxylase [Polynucleobacter sp. es-GGE-1]MBU3635542.1 phosphonopyruvate decarboxylase [Polynucleobacter sp. es-GGE-1]
MLNPDLLIDTLYECGVRLFSGVPDSLLKNFNSSLDLYDKKITHIPAVNEGSAIGLAIGAYLSNSVPAVVYMQNSGLGNALNPLTSLAHKDIYGIPIFLIIGWRGEPGYKDEPQHVVQGRITKDQLDLINIDYLVVDECTDIELEVKKLWDEMLSKNQPVALLFKNNVFSESNKPLLNLPKYTKKTDLSREAAIEGVLTYADRASFFIVTTGKAGRELYELRIKRGEPHFDFLTVGGMGHASSIALGASISMQDREVICLDGDGALLMHMGSLATVGRIAPKNLVHVLLNNGTHESVGGQQSGIDCVDLRKITEACNYEYHYASTLKEIEDFFIKRSRGAKEKVSFLEIRVLSNSRSELGRPKILPQDNKKDCMRFLSNE